MKNSKVFDRGGKMWLTFYCPKGERRRMPTGTSDPEIADRTRVMVDELLEEREARHWFDKLTAKPAQTDLSKMYDRRSRGQLEAYAKELAGVGEQALADAKAAADAAAAAGTNLEPYVEPFIKQIKGRQLSKSQESQYVRQIRVFLPENVPFPHYNFHGDQFIETLAAYRSPRGKALSPSSYHNFLAGVRLFFKYVRHADKALQLLDPFDTQSIWLPDKNGPRMVYWTHAEVRERLAKMVAGSWHEAAMYLLFGTGIELVALRAVTVGDILGIDASRRFTAHGTKNETREDRPMTLDAWALPVVRAFAEARVAAGAALLAPLFDELDVKGKSLREVFYELQVALELISAPPVTDTTVKGNIKKLWGQVVEPKHDLHDCRHSYCFNRILGQDGEERKDREFCARQLGHGSNQMVDTVYNKQDVKDLLEQIRVREAFEAGERAAAMAAQLSAAATLRAMKGEIQSALAELREVASAA